MSIVNQFFDFFKQKDVNKATGAENNTGEDNVAPLVVQANRNVASMVKADDFQDSSIEPEEYTLEDKEEFVPEENDAIGISVDDGDDMSPIIMDGREEIIVSEEEIDKVINDPTHKHEVLEYPITIVDHDDEDEDAEVLDVNEEVEVL